MAQGPQVTATITGVDQLSPLLQKLENDARGFGERTGRGFKGIDEAGNASARRLEQGYTGATSRIGVAFGALAVTAGAAFSRMAEDFARSTVRIGEEIEKTNRKILSFTSTTPAQLDALRKQADTTYAKYGPANFMAGANSALSSGVRPDAAAAAAEWGLKFGRETGEPAETATQKIIAHAQVTGEVKDDQGRSISTNDATPAQLERGLHKTQNLLLATKRTEPGTLDQYYESAKFFGPTTTSLGLEPEAGFAMMGKLYEKGIEGEEAGVAIRSGVGSIVAPTAKGRAALKESGIDYGSFVKLNEAALKTDDIISGLELRAGTMSDKTKRDIRSELDTYRQSKDVDIFQKSLAETLVASGSKSMQNRVTAGNVAAQTVGTLTGTTDVVGLLDKMGQAHLGIGAYNAIFGVQQGGRLKVLAEGGDLTARMDKLKRIEAEDPATRATEEYEKSYTGRKQSAENRTEAVKDRAFQAAEPALGAAYDFKGWLADKTSQMPPWLLGAGTFGAGVAGKAYENIGLPVAGALGALWLSNRTISGVANAVAKGAPAATKVAEPAANIATAGLDAASREAGAKLAASVSNTLADSVLKAPHLSADAAKGAMEAAAKGTTSALPETLSRIGETAADAATKGSKLVGFLEGLGTVLRGIDVATAPLILRELGEQHSPTTPENFPYKNDTWAPDAPAIRERAERARKYWQGEDTLAGHMGGPEAARGDAWRGRAALGYDTQGNRDYREQAGPPKPVAPVSVNVKGEAEIVQHMEMSVQPSPLLLATVRSAQQIVRIGLHDGNEMKGHVQEPQGIFHGPH